MKCDRIPLIYSAMASQFASGFAERYRQEHPNANPAEVQKAATDATERMQQMWKAIPADELLDAMIPIYQKYFTHSDIKTINEFYGSLTGQKLLKNTPAMMIDSTQAVQALMKEHMPEIQAQIEKAPAGDSLRTNGVVAPPPPATASASILASQEVSQGLLVKQVPPVYPPLARQARIQGAVVLQAIIGKDGSIENLELVSGHPMLVNAAMNAVKQWQYKPYVLNGAAIEVQTTINVNFSLADNTQTKRP